MTVPSDCPRLCGDSGCYSHHLLFRLNFVCAAVAFSVLLGLLLALSVWLVMRSPGGPRGRAALRAQDERRAGGGRARGSKPRSPPSGGPRRKSSRCWRRPTSCARRSPRSPPTPSARTTKRSSSSRGRRSASSSRRPGHDLDGRQKAIEDLVQPLRDSLTKVDAKLSEVEREPRRHASALTEQLRSLTLAQQALQVETGRLVQALRSPNIRGQWGELQLRRVLEAAGMLEGTATSISRSPSHADGAPADARRHRPPAGRQERRRRRQGPARRPSSTRWSRTTTAQRERKLRDHARQVRDHVVRLGNKTYWQHFQPTPDIVVMFVPGETLLSAALQHDPRCSSSA